MNGEYHKWILDTFAHDDLQSSLNEVTTHRD